MYILGIESSCDETAASIVEDGVHILSNVVLSQIDLHKEFGGVYPELASRAHLDHMLEAVELCLHQANLRLDQIGAIAVATRPGLVGSLIIGTTTAKALAYSLNLPLIGVDHVQAHIYSSMMGHLDEIVYPAIGLVLSGGHTLIVKVDSPTEFTTLGSTIDDAIGEAFDKVAKMLGLPYPGGPEIEKLARFGNSLKYPFKAGENFDTPYNISYSGLKTQVLREIQRLKKTNSLDDSEKNHLAASFQLAAFSKISYKGLKAASSYQCRHLLLGGGVSNNSFLRKLLAEHAPPTLSILYPPSGLCLDNAAMIAALGYHYYLKSPEGDSLDLSPTPVSSLVASS